MIKEEWIKLTRDCAATAIPGGEKGTLPKGTQVRITQSLGGSDTVMTEQGFMVRIEGKDADALGKELLPEDKEKAEAEAKRPLEERVWEQLKLVFDPEIPVNIADLGLIYDCEITAGEAGNTVGIKMTLTAPGCGMGEVLRQDVQTRVSGLAGVSDVGVELVWDPPWDRDMMSEAAKLQLGML